MLFVEKNEMYIDPMCAQKSELLRLADGKVPIQIDYQSSLRNPKTNN